MLVPLYGFLEGDTLGLLVLAHDTDLIGTVALKLQASAELRVESFAPFEVICGETSLDLEQTVKKAGLKALDRIVVKRVPHG